MHKLNFGIAKIFFFIHSFIRFVRSAPFLTLFLFSFTVRKKRITTNCFDYFVYIIVERIDHVFYNTDERKQKLWIHFVHTGQQRHTHGDRVQQKRKNLHIIWKYIKRRVRRNMHALQRHRSWSKTVRGVSSLLRCRTKTATNDLVDKMTKQIIQSSTRISVFM